MPIPRVLHAEQNVSSLFKKRATEGLDVVRAAFDLARAEATGATQRYVTGGIICDAHFVVASATSVILAQAATCALQPYFRGPAMACLITGLVMFLLITFLGWPGLNFSTRQYQSVGRNFKLLTGQRRTSRANFLNLKLEY